MLEAEEAQDVNATLLDLVKSKDSRLWEGFPVVLANCAQRGLFNYEAVMKQLKTPNEQKTFKRLLLVSLVLYKVVNVKFSWADSLVKVAGFKKDEFNKAYQELKKKRNKVMYEGLSPDRLKSVFRNYFMQEENRLVEFASAQEELGLEYALSQVFSPKQKELFLKRLKNEKMTKTEREYYSRVVKKKVEALANPELHKLAKNV
ncbi:MAG: hypothetical protein ISS45_10395 [Candidatus Omnitrophica bacterium]|nr:hypothetical protein [Candidatus Omnitrophota bacterium]